MKSKFGRGFVTNIMLLSKHFGLTPDQAFLGASDHLDEFNMPDIFRGTEVEEYVEMLRKKVIWHQPGMNDREDAEDVIRTLNRLVVAIDRELGIEDADVGEYD